MTMYASRNFKSKREFKLAVDSGERITLFAPGLGSPKANGTEYVSGPHYPEPHKWYATCTIVNGVVTKVK